MSIDEKDTAALLISSIESARQDIISDKSNLAQFFVAKGVIAGALVASADLGFLDVAVFATAFVIQIIDLFYRKRLNEIFIRWHYISNNAYPQLEKLEVIDQSIAKTALETQIWEKREKIFAEERRILSVLAFPFFALAPLAAASALTTNLCTWGVEPRASVFITFLAILGFYFLLFSDHLGNQGRKVGFRKYSDTYYPLGFVFASTLGLIIGLLAIQYGLVNASNCISSSFTKNGL